MRGFEADAARDAVKAGGTIVELTPEQREVWRKGWSRPGRRWSRRSAATASLLQGKMEAARERPAGKKA